MPQASDELREKMFQRFGDAIDDFRPTRFLIERGYREHGGLWRRPSLDHVATADEIECLQFLHDEWDHDYDAEGVWT
jgi:hypothetical protein